MSRVTSAASCHWTGRFLRPIPVFEEPQILHHDAIQHFVVPLNLIQHVAHVALDDDELAVGHRVEVKYISEVRIFGRQPGEVILIEDGVSHDLRGEEDLCFEIGYVIPETLHKFMVTAGKLLERYNPREELGLVGRVLTCL